MSADAPELVLVRALNQATYCRMLEVQARMLAAFVRGTTPRYTGLTV